MTNVLANLVRMTTNTTGTGTITLGSAVQGFNAFADEIASGSVITYAIEDGHQREVGQGTFTISGAIHTLIRDKVYSSTQGGSLISLSGSAQVFVTAAAQDFAPFETGAAATAIAAAATAEEAAASAEAQAAIARAAAESSGAIQFFDTKAAATAALGGLTENDVVEVLADESRSGTRTRYRVEASALVYKLTLGTAETVVVATRAAAAAIAPLLPTGAIVRLTEAGRAGDFVMRAGAFSAALTHRQLTATSVNVGSETVTCANHYMDTGSTIWVDADTHGLTAKKLYWVKRDTTNTFRLAASFADLEAGTYHNFTSGAGFTFKHGGDGWQALYIIPDGYAEDGSEGALVRVVDGTTYDCEWLGLDGTFDHEQAAISSLANLAPHGSTILLPRRQINVSRFCYVRWRSGVTIDGCGRQAHLRGNGGAYDLLRIHTNGCLVRGTKFSNVQGDTPSEMPVIGNAGEAAGVKWWNLGESTDWDGSPIYNAMVDNCEFSEIENGVVTQTNWSNPASQTNKQYHIERVWVTNCDVEAKRNCLEIFCGEYAFLQHNRLRNIDPAGLTGSGIRRGIRLVGVRKAEVSSNWIWGYTDASTSTWGVSIEQAGLSDFPVGHRHPANVRVHHNWIESFGIGINVQSGRGTIMIDHNQIIGNRSTMPSTAASVAVRRADAGYSESGGNGVVVFNATTDVGTYVSPLTQFPQNLPGIRLYTNGTLPSPLVAGDLYYMVNPTSGATSGTFQVAATEGGAPIDLTDAGTGTHEFVLEEFLPVKNRTDFLTVVNNQAYGVARMYQGAGACDFVKIEGNVHVGNQATTSCFAAQDTFPDIPGLDISRHTVIRGNRGFYRPTNTGGCVNFGPSGTRAGEYVDVDDNVFEWNAVHPLVQDSGAGVVRITSSTSNVRLPTGHWTETYATWPEFGPFDIGPRP